MCGSVLLGTPTHSATAFGLRRAMLEDGGPLDTSPQLQTGLILETLGDIEEAAVRNNWRLHDVNRKCFFNGDVCSSFARASSEGFGKCFCVLGGRLRAN